MPHDCCPLDKIMATCQQRSLPRYRQTPPSDRILNLVGSRSPRRRKISIRACSKGDRQLSFKKYVVCFSLVALSKVKIVIIQILLLNLTYTNKNVKVIKEKIKR